MISLGGVMTGFQRFLLAIVILVYNILVLYTSYCRILYLIHLCHMVAHSFQLQGSSKQIELVQIVSKYRCKDTK